MDIEITEAKRSADTNTPSHLCPGDNTDTVYFKVLGAHRPTTKLINHLISQECSDWVLTTYNEFSGAGCFYCVDIDGPQVGLVVSLVSPVPLPESRRIVFERSAPEDPPHGDAP